VSLSAWSGKQKHNSSIGFSKAILKYPRSSMPICNSLVTRQAIKASYQYRVGRASHVCAAGVCLAERKKTAGKLARQPKRLLV